MSLLTSSPAVHYGTIRDFVEHREQTATGIFGENLEHYQAFAVELDGLVQSFLYQGSAPLRAYAKWRAPRLLRLTKDAIDKYLVALKEWQNVLTFPELEAFVTEEFVWR